MKEMKRAIHFDFHTLPGISDFCEKYDPEKFADLLSEANVGYVNVFARCNLGFSYYPTKVGTPYPGLKTDMCGETIRALKKRGIGVTAYVNGGLNHNYMIQNPGTMRVTKDGNVYVNPNENMNFFRTHCFNSEYAEHLLAEIEEVLKMDPDGIFVDGMNARECYCPRCISKMKQQGIDFRKDDEVWDFAVDTLKSVITRIREIVPADKRLYINSVSYDYIHECQSHAELECLPTSGIWGYDYITTFAPYYRMFNDDTIYMTGAFVSDWGDFGGKKSVAALENDVFDALLYGYTPSIGDHMHPRGVLNEKLYKEIGKVYGYVKELEKWTDDSVPVCDVAIIRNKTTNSKLKNFVTDSEKGAARMLSELKICFNILNEDMDFGGYKLIVLPDEIELTDKLLRKLENFDGAILSSGRSCKDGSVWDYIDISDDDNTDGYYQYNGEIFGQYVTGVKIKSDYSIADYVEPYFKREFDGVHAYFYNPDYKSKGYSAVAVKGNRAHICFNVFEAYIRYGAIFHKELVEDIINILLPDRIIRNISLPSYSRATLMNGKEGDILHIKVTAPELRGGKGIIEDHFSLCAGKQVSVQGVYNAAYSLPDMIKVQSTVEDDRTVITLPEINGYMPFLLKK